MQKLKLLKNYSTTDGGFYGKGEIIEVSNNIAHGLVERDIAVLFFSNPKIMKPPMDKMMRTRNKRYKTK